jgi:hypothetical protein
MSLLWGLKSDGAWLVRGVRAVLLGGLSSSIPTLTTIGTGTPLTPLQIKASIAAGAVGGLAGWLRAGEKNDPAPPSA